MWPIAVLGTFFLWAPLHAFYLTTAVAVALEFLFTTRGFTIGWHMSLLPGILCSFVVFSWLLPSMEALTQTLIFGLIAMKMEVSFIPAKVIIFGTVIGDWAVAHHRGIIWIALWHVELSCYQFWLVCHSLSEQLSFMATTQDDDTWCLQAIWPAASSASDQMLQMTMKMHCLNGWNELLQAISLGAILPDPASNKRDPLPTLLQIAVAITKSAALNVDTSSRGQDVPPQIPLVPWSNLILP
ncbi:uncharacterized protein BJ212DRAFT_1500064 [Suillus subaureus]|uniref:Uncharacterized protein n=1 Tax=Suillus subaureus TaxID=48587 RepID=A0A9P7EDD6_9AGAM|nr:uncharacterized protein BJ212DRAFT_1500064 [Suillus subaureus]KAG1817608.1 hypothetical protein BJ212DRAFT_1500064 [Suillus subaureus]